MKLLNIIFLHLFLEFTYSQSGWFNVVSNVPDDLNSVFFTSIQTGYACGNSGRIIKTNNGGQTWDSVTTLNYSHDLLGTFFVNQLTGFAVGNSCLYKTTNAGVNWTFSSAFNSIYAYKVSFFNENTGIVIGSSKIVRTTNSGSSWNQMTLDDNYLTDVTCVNSSTAYVLCNTGFDCQVLKTTDSGNSWFVYFQIYCFIGSNVQLLSENILFALGKDCYSNNFIPRIYGTTNGGVNWFSRQLEGGFDTYKGIFFTNAITGYVCGINGMILKTTNCGDSWYDQTLGQGGPQLNELIFLNDSIGFAIGGNGRVKKTINGGGPIGIYRISSDMPTDFKLHRNYPNPFNPVTKIRFDIPSNSHHGGNDNVVLKVYDILGKEIAILVNKSLQPGFYEVDFSGTNYPSGVYFCRLIAEDFSRTIKMILLK